jgi:hypothetical protein
MVTKGADTSLRKKSLCQNSDIYQAMPNALQTASLHTLCTNAGCWAMQLAASQCWQARAAICAAGKHPRSQCCPASASLSNGSMSKAIASSSQTLEAIILCASQTNEHRLLQLPSSRGSGIREGAEVRDCK